MQKTTVSVTRSRNWTYSTDSIRRPPPGRDAAKAGSRAPAVHRKAGKETGSLIGFALIGAVPRIWVPRSDKSPLVIGVAWHPDPQGERHNLGNICLSGKLDCSTKRILLLMTTPVPTRFSDEELATIDRLVSEGVGANRSAVIRVAVVLLDDAVRRTRIGESIAESYRRQPQSNDDDTMAMANAIAMTEAEPW